MINATLHRERTSHQGGRPTFKSDRRAFVVLGAASADANFS